MIIFGLIGYPLKHSFSYRFFNEKFTLENISAEYLNFEIPSITDFPNIIESNNNLNGLNVTIPYKEQVIPFLDELDPVAQAIGAVNVIKIIRKDDNTVRLKGYNSDYIGFRDSIAELINPQIHKQAFILGTGGASKAVEYGLKDLNIKSVYVSRSAKNGALTYGDLDEKIMSEYQIIVNSSPLGTYPNVDECPDIPYNLITEKHLLYDLVYNPPLTKFLALGKANGAKIKNGAEMLELQALAAWKVWNNE